MISGTYCGCSPSSAAWTFAVQMLRRYHWRGDSTSYPLQSGWLAKVEYPRV